MTWLKTINSCFHYAGDKHAKTTINTKEKYLKKTHVSCCLGALYQYTSVCLLHTKLKCPIILNLSRRPVCMEDTWVTLATGELVFYMYLSTASLWTISFVVLYLYLDNLNRFCFSSLRGNCIFEWAFKVGLIAGFKFLVSFCSAAFCLHNYKDYQERLIQTWVSSLVFVSPPLF